ANPEVVLEWISKGGVAIDPPSSTVIVTDEDIQDEALLVLRINLVLDDVAIHEFGFLVIFDGDLRNELDFPFGDEPQAPDAYDSFTPIGFFSAFESLDTVGGEIGPYRGCVVGSVCDLDESIAGTPVGNRTIEIAQVNFLATAMASNDRRDIVIHDVPLNEEFRDANGDIIDHADIVFGSASIVPEPSAAMLTASALASLAVLARKRSRSVA
ncbi:MAG: hypothetical protein JRE71_09965, partial [Deltaproteobacteria bacterium]|nr:hypothetical protein [Deltaproteobacteria bacterium]